MIRFCFTLLTALLFVTASQAQVSKMIEEANKLYFANKYTEAEKKYEELLKEPLVQKTLSLKGFVYYFLGLCSYQQGKYEPAIPRFKNGMEYYHLAKSDSSVKDIMYYLSRCYKKAGSKYYQQNLSFDSSETSNEIFFPVSAVDSAKGDTVMLIINGGYNAGVFEEARGHVMLSYNSDRPKTLNNDYVATAKVITSTTNLSYVQAVFYNKISPAKKKLVTGDLVVLKLYKPKEKINNIFYELASLGIIFKHAGRDTLLSQTAILNDPSKEMENQIMDYLIWDNRNFYKTFLEERTDSTFNTIYKKGRFKAMTMKDAFRYAEEEDLMAFLQFVKTFPGKYMGKAWQFNETYATWVLNDVPTGASGKQWLLPYINKTALNDIDDYTNKFSWYISNDSLITYREAVNDVYKTGDNKQALTLCNKLYRISQLLNDKASQLDFIYYRSFLYQRMDDTPNAMNDAKIAFALNPKLPNVVSNLAYLYAKLEKYDTAFMYLDPLIKANADRHDIAGNTGWYKILAGKWEEAKVLCKTGYEADKNSYSYAVNYGHTFLLDGQMDSAYKYYARSLENLYYPNDYADGPKKDFELFFTKGWSRKAAAEALDWMEQQYNTKYSYITRGNVIWDTAKKFYDEKNYRVAADKWKEYIKVYEGAKEPPLSYIHNAYSWIGSSYEKAKDSANAEKYYLTGLQMARDTFMNTDKLSNDYQRLYNFYTSYKNTAKAREYKLMYDVEKQKIDDVKSRPQLYLVAVEGKNTSQPESRGNAKSFFENISSTVSKSFDSLHTYYVGEKSLSKTYLLNLLDSIKKISRPEDVLVFYYTGTITDENKERYYLLKPGAGNGEEKVTEDELVNAVKNISSQKKLLVSDIPAPGIMSKISESYSSVSYALNEVMFLCPGVLTPVNNSTGLSAFTEQLTTSVSELAKHTKFTAKDLLAKTSEGLGVNKYYLPVLSFAYAKDFILYKSEQTRGEEAVTRSTIEEEPAQPGINNATGAAGKNYALLFGTDIYKDYNKLNNAVYDVTKLAKLLKDDFGFETELLTNVNKEDIENKLIDYRDSKIYGDNDQLFIYFAGHGIVDKKENMGYLVASDSRKTDAKKYSFFSYSDLFGKYLKNIKCKRIFLVLDACHAGTFFDQSISRGDPPSSKDARDILKKNANGKKLYMGISSGNDEPVSDGNPGEHSPFAKSFMNTLNDNGEFITAGILVEILKANLPSNTMVRGGQFNTSDVGGQFIFEFKTKSSGTPEIKSADFGKKIGG